MSKKIWLILMLLSLMTLFPLSVMAEEFEANASDNIQVEELPIEPVEDVKVKTIETKTKEGLLVEETSVLKSQLPYILSAKADSNLQTCQLGEDVESEIMTKMKESLVNLDSEINLSEYQIPYEERGESSLTRVSKLYYKVINDNPDLFYMAPKITTYYNSDQMTEKVVFTYMCNDNEITGQLSEDETVAVMAEISKYETGIQNLIYAANIQDTMSEEEKVLALHDALCNWASYDYTYKNYSSYDIVVNKTGVCQAYAIAFNDLLWHVGIKSKLVAVSNLSLNHAWNLVEIDDEWYHVDVTWDDDQFSSFMNINRTYFLKSDANFKSHPGFYTGVIADSEKYEDYHFPSSPMYYEGGKWYYYEEWKNYSTGVSFNGIVSSNIDKSDKETVIDTDMGDYVVLNGKIYYTRSDIRRGSSLNKRNIFSCDIDGSNESLFKVVSNDEDAMISSLYILRESLGCDIIFPNAKIEPYGETKVYDGLPTKISISSFTADKRTGQLVDAKVNLAVTASGGTAPNEYRFYYKSGSETNTIQDYSSSNTAVFCPEQAGYYDLYVEVKDSEGQVAISKINNFQIVDANSELTAYYTTHVQNIGWQDWVPDGEMSGTEGKGLRLEGIKIELSKKEGVGISYSTHVQNVGWQEPVSNGTMSGTEGLGYRLEAIKINLTGENANKYDVYYRVHAQNVGWMGWASNGAEAGTAGLSYRLEGIEIQIVDKGAVAPGSTENAFQDANKGSKYTAENYTVIPYQLDYSKCVWSGFGDAKYIMQAPQQSTALKININDYTDIDMITHNEISNPVAYSMVIYTGDLKFFETGDFYRTDSETSVINKLKGIWSPSEIHIDGVKIVFSKTYITGFVDTSVYMVIPEQINNLGHTV